MTVIDTTSLFLHVLAAVGLIGGGMVQILAGTRVRAAATGDELASWSSFARTANLVIVGSAVLSLLTGGHLAGAVWGGSAGGFANPFITLGLVGLLVLAPVGPMLGGAKLRRITDDARPVAGQPLPADLAARASGSSLWGPVHSLVGVGVGLVALMVYKPGWVTGSVLVVLTFALGWGAGVVVSRRPESGAPPAP